MRIKYNGDKYTLEMKYEWLVFTVFGFFTPTHIGKKQTQLMLVPVYVHVCRVMIIKE